MKTIHIYVLGKFEYKTGIGTWIYYLNYKDAVIKRTGNIENAKCPVRVALYSLYIALQQVKEPCYIIIHSKAALGFKYPKKSSNKDILVKIQRVINNLGHSVEMIVDTDFSIIDEWENMYNKPKTNRQQKPQERYPAAYIEQKINENKDWRSMYSDLMGPSEGAWQAGMGGY